MTNALHAQIRMASSFTHQTWPQVVEQAVGSIPRPRGRDQSVYICGCGDSHHAAKGLEMAFSSWCGWNARAGSAMEVGRYVLPAHPEHTPKPHVIAISSSGEVARTIEVIEIANRLGFPSIAITNSGESTLAHTARYKLVTPLESLPKSPGLISYLSSLLAGWAIAYHWSIGTARDQVGKTVEAAIDLLGEWILSERENATVATRRFSSRLPLLFLGSGPAYGSAMFAAAKLIESTGRMAWAQDVEEWCHLEYFCDPAELPIWILRAHGRSDNREQEVISATQAIGRVVILSEWRGIEGGIENLSETLAPLFLWAGPTWFAADMMDILRETAFRGFAGGRSASEGGGASRIRSSQRLQDPASRSP